MPANTSPVLRTIKCFLSSSHNNRHLLSPHLYTSNDYNITEVLSAHNSVQLEPVSLSKLLFCCELLHSLYIKSLKNEVGTAAVSCDKKSSLLYVRSDTYIHTYRDTYIFNDWKYPEPFKEDAGGWRYRST
jgi:hypothetical protein